jgi:hypothetical protein
MSSMSAATDASFSFKRSAEACGMAKHATTWWLGWRMSGVEATRERRDRSQGRGGFER